LHKNKQTPHPKPLIIEAKPASIIAAGSLAVLTILFFWGFELRSISRLFLQSVVLMVPLWLGLYFFLYRKLSFSISFDFKVLITGILLSVFFSYQIIAPQINLSNYVFMIVITSLMFLLFYLSFLMTLLNNEKMRLNNIFLTLAFIFGFIGTLIVIFNSLSIRMYGDDFCSAVQFEKLGLWKSGLWLYNSWSARFFSNFLVVGFSNQYRAPIIFLFFIPLSLYFSFLNIVKSDLVERCLLALAVAFFIPFSIYIVTPDLYKSLYWISSALTLLPLLVMIPIYLTIINQYLSTNQRNFQWSLIVGMLLSFAISTTHEVAALGWLIMHAIGLIWFYLVGSKNIGLRNYLFAGLISASIGIIVLLSSPGVGARVASQTFPPPPPVKEIILLTTRDFLDFIKNISWPIYQYHGESRSGWFFIVAAGGLGWISETTIRRHFRSAALVFITTIAMVVVSFFPGVYITSSTIPLRTQFIPSLYLVFGVFVFGTCLPRFTNNLLKTSLTFLIMMIMFSGARISLSQLMLTIEPMRQFAREWDLRDETVRTTSELPQRIEDVPWDKHEQGFNCVQLYYQTKK